MSWVGYFWFISNYTDVSGNTIRAAYLLQAFPFLALMSGMFLRGLLARSPRVAAVFVVLLVAVTAHNAPAMVTNNECDSDCVGRE